MNITINRSKLQTALRIVERVISKNTSLPILNTILLKTENNQLKLLATNLEIGIKYWISARINQEGEIAVPARIFSDFIGNINDEKLTLGVDKNIITINSDHYKTQILGLGTKDFPLLPKTKSAEKFIINSVVFKGALMSVLDSVSLSETRPEISGVSMTISKDKAIFAATDSFRLAEKIVSVSNGLPGSIIIPRNSALELIKINENNNTDLSMIISDNQLFITGEDYEFVTRLIDGHYPEYRKIIPEKFISAAKINKNDLERNVRMASIFSSTIFDIKLKAENNNIEIKAKNNDRGEITANTPCLTKDTPFEVAVNYRYLLDGVKIIPTDEVLIQFTGEGSPLVLKADDKSDIIYLIMPLRS